jgi:alpha-L-rhamnosidase
MLKACFFLFFLLGSGYAKVEAQSSVVEALCENKPYALGVSTDHPHFSWELSSKHLSESQTSFQIVVATSKSNLASGIADVWNSLIVHSDKSVLVPYTGQPLKSATLYYWKVRVWDNKRVRSPWSQPAMFCTGIADLSNWKNAKWIGFEDLPDSMRIAPGVHAPLVSTLKGKGLERPITPLLRKIFTVSKIVSKAIVFISGLGQYDLTINGTEAGKGFLTPGWTYYDKRCEYDVLDVTSLLKNGDNCAGIILGNGFFNITRERYFKLVDAFGFPKLICRLKIDYSDGSSDDIVSDDTWKTASSAITFTSIYGGEDYDARLDQKGWDQPGFDDKQWKRAELVKAPIGQLVADLDNPVAIMDSFTVRKVIHPKPGICIYDFGQNSSGIIQLKIKGQRGQVLRIYPAEILSGDTVVNQDATGKPYYWSYTLKGGGIETWHPKFTYYGFRYVQITDAIPSDSPGSSLPVIVRLQSLHTRNSSASNGSFSCSNPLFNRIYDLINWAIKSNYQSVVTDCPTREKLSWLEQDYLMGNSIHYNFDNYGLYHKLVFDLMDAQTPEGFVPDIAPEFVKFDNGFLDSPEWGSACVILPWLLYTWNDDPDMLNIAYPMMTKYVEYLERKSENHILSYGLGDWFDYGPGRPGVAQLTPISLTATAIYYYDVALLSKMALILNKGDDASRYDQLATQIKAAFNGKFFNAPTGVYSTGSQTAMAMPLSVGLVDERSRMTVLKNLTDSIKMHHYALTAGDIGFHFLISALDDGGRSDVIYKMNNRDDVPGYGFQLKKGATSLTESWPALENVSNNHLMLGHIMEWFYSGLAGISQENISVGYRKLKIRPQPIGDIEWAKGSFHTPYGWVSTSWHKTESNFFLEVSIPVNATATIYLPANGNAHVFINGKLRKADIEKGSFIVPCGSGLYRFEVK